ncbi:hypothetical protein PVA45_05450 [Entomospira entomophila]|uniref:Capsule assembly Wzi family protein n=1 Tax=Entomospira entomophila TaxID=2719988 RepID=A0A968GDD7_9SPIO|nr:hypothetical protein [Entomospira entomophilus]NIZ40944.1 hypothetical protein [Entomospira entomophilus]WDI35157.1 hypothetical protein PVA45_05450 [Entomospira entomophilus]
MKFRLFIVVMSVLWMYRPSYALLKIGFVDIFPTVRVTSRNFKVESIDRLFYTQYHLSPKAFVVGIDYQIVGIHFFVALDFMRNLEAEFYKMTWTNLPVGKNLAASASTNFPSEGFIGYHNDVITASIGRRRAHLGPGNHGLMLSRYTPYFDGIWLSLHPKTRENQRFFYTFFLAADDTAALNRLWNAFDPYAADVMQLNRYQQRTKFLAVHRIGYQFEFLKFGIGESSIISGIPLTFFNANPMNFWHNTYEVGLNVTLGFDIEGVIGKKRNIRLYGEFLLDDVKTSVEPGGNPLAFGLSLGAQWHVFERDEEHFGPNFDYTRNTLQEGGFNFTGKSGLVLGFQAVWATRYLYSRAMDDPLGKFTFHNQLQLGVGHWSVLENYIGFTHGPDSVLLEFQADYIDKNWRIQSTFGIFLWGESGRANSGFLPTYQGNIAIGGLFDPINDLGNVFLSGVESVLLLPKVNVFYAFKRWLSVYGGFSAEIDILHITQSRITVESGVAMRF